MNEQIRQLMLESGYAAPHIAKKAQTLAHKLILLCADIAATNPIYAQQNIEKLLNPENLKE